MADHSCPLLDSEPSEGRIMEDAAESQPLTKLEIMSKQQVVSQPVTIHSSLTTISAVCNKITTMDL